MTPPKSERGGGGGWGEEGIKLDIQIWKFLNYKEQGYLRAHFTCFFLVWKESKVFRFSNPLIVNKLKKKNFADTIL